ncbi:MAG: hypothetical protein ACI808_001839 [Paraglaciecola sp.]|jgi:hypothetical protein
MKKILKWTVLTLGSMMLVLPVLAGQVQPAAVDVQLDIFFASGDLIAARTAKNDDVFIGCGTRNEEVDDDGTMFNWAFCQATDEEGDSVTCLTFNPELVRTVREINDSSYVTFSWSDDGLGNLTCKRMGFSTQSFYLGNDVKGN